MKKQLTLIISLLTLFVLSASAQDTSVRSKSFTVSKGGRFEITTRSGDIRITPWSKNEVSVTAEGIDSEDLDRLKMTQSGNTVRVEFLPKKGWGGWDGDHIRFDVSVPTDFNIEMKTSGGDLEIMGSINGKIEGSTSGGDINIENVVGPVDMSTSGGDIKVGDIKGNVDLSTSGGDITLKKVDGEARVKTSGGDIRVESVGKKLDARTSGGDIEIGDVGGEVSASTAGGDVKVKKVSGDAKLKSAGGDIGLSGASGTVVASTAGGDINLMNITGSIEAKTAGGDIKAELRPSGKGGSELSTAGGKVSLAVPENAKVTIEALIRIEGRWGSRKSKYEVRSDFKADKYETDEDEEEIRATYNLNGGGEKIFLSTVNSSIEIRKLR